MQSGQIAHLPNYPTVKQLSAAKEGSPPLFWCFNRPDKEMLQLSEKWDNSQTLYGFYSGDLGETDSLKKVAAHYTQVIKELANQGPFYLGGNCRGARLAEQILLNLKKENHPPQKVIFMEYANIQHLQPTAPTLFLFGKSSIVDEEVQRAFWLSSESNDTQLQAERLTGSHGRFFEEKNLSSFLSHLTAFIKP